MRFLENRISAKKPDPDVWEKLGTMGIIIIFNFEQAFNHGLKKIQESGQFGTNPETGQNLSGKIFPTKFFQFTNEFDGMIKILLGGAIFSNSNTWSLKITTTTK